MPVINLDTHVLLFALTGKVTARERRVLAASPWSISAIVLWEIAKLAQLGRVTIDLDNREIVRTLSGLHVWPVDLAISIQSTRLDFRSDPADELIAATSVVHRIPLLTRDRRIRVSKIVPLA
jgi:PIN domain nuclease of toxin-antitoxin system